MKIDDKMEEYLSSIERSAKDLGFKNVHRKIVLDEIVLEDNKYFKGNLPKSSEGFESGNGEGCWFQALTDKDLEVERNNIKDETFEAILLNDSLYFLNIFMYGTVIKLKCRGEDRRPVLDYDWLDDIIKKSSNNEMNLAKMLNY